MHKCYILLVGAGSSETESQRRCQLSSAQIETLAFDDAGSGNQHQDDHVSLHSTIVMRVEVVISQPFSCVQGKVSVL